MITLETSIYFTFNIKDLFSNNYETNNTQNGTDKIGKKDNSSTNNDEVIEPPVNDDKVNDTIKDNDKVNDDVIIDDTDNSMDTNRIIKIIDNTPDKCASAIEYYYEDSGYKYYFNCIKSHNVYVNIGKKKYNIKEALNNGIVTMTEL